MDMKKFREIKIPEHIMLGEDSLVNSYFEAVDKVYEKEINMINSLNMPNIDDQEKIEDSDVDDVDDVKDTKWEESIEKIPEDHYIVLAFGYFRDEYNGEDEEVQEKLSRICLAYTCGKYGWKNYQNERSMIILNWCHITYPNGDIFEV